MSNCYKCSCSCNKMKIIKGGYVPSSVSCSKNFSFKNCKKEIVVKEELTDIFLSNNEIVELSPVNSEIGTFTNGINERGFFILYSNFRGQNDNDKFIIKGNKLKSKKVLQYIPGVTYKVTVKYIGHRHYKQKDFDIIVKNSKDNTKLVVGTQVQASSADNNIDLIFDNITTSGEVTFAQINPTASDVLFYDINSTAEFNGNITISFNNSNINPDNNPVITHLRYDDELEEVFYENVTTEVVEGKITGVVNSLSPFSLWFTAPPDAWGAAPNCGFTLDYTPPPPCPGNQTRGNWAITEDGIGPPRLLGGTCGCWEPSIITVDTIIGAASSYGAIKGGICALIKNISNLKSLLKSLADDLIEIKDSIKYFADKILNFENIISAKQALIKDFKLQITNLESKIDILNVSLESLQDDLAVLQKKLLDKYDAIPDPGSPQGADSDTIRYWQIHAQKQSKADEVARLNDIIESRTNDISNISYELEEGPESPIKLRDEAEVELKEQKYREFLKEQEITTKKDLLKNEETTLFGKMQDLAASIFALYGFLNEISIQKDCPGQTLNPLTCECCDNCAGDKVFPDPMRGCDCECPSGKEPCLNAGDDNCYDECGTDQIRSGVGCPCVCIDSNKQICGDACCPEGQICDNEECKQAPGLIWVCKGDATGCVQCYNDLAPGSFTNPGGHPLCSSLGTLDTGAQGGTESECNSLCGQKVKYWVCGSGGCYEMETIEVGGAVPINGYATKSECDAGCRQPEPEAG